MNYGTQIQLVLLERRQLCKDVITGMFQTQVVSANISGSDVYPMGYREQSLSHLSEQRRK